MNRWRRKQRKFIKCFDIHLKTIVLKEYRGTRSQVNFASFFLQNAKKLELMTLEVDNRVANCAFFAEQYGVLQMEKRASRTAQLQFTTKRCRRDAHVNHVRDLAITDPFECRCWDIGIGFCPSKILLPISCYCVLCKQLLLVHMVFQIFCYPRTMKYFF